MKFITNIFKRSTHKVTYSYKVGTTVAETSKSFTSLNEALAFTEKLGRDKSVFAYVIKPL